MSKKETANEKTTKETKTKEVKKTAKKKETKKEVKNKEPFLTGVRKEMKKVRWPLKKEMVKYSIATLVFIIFFALFFTLGDLVIAGIKMLVA